MGRGAGRGRNTPYMGRGPGPWCPVAWGQTGLLPLEGDGSSAGLHSFHNFTTGLDAGQDQARREVYRTYCRDLVRFLPVCYPGGGGGGGVVSPAIGKERAMRTRDPWSGGAQGVDGQYNARRSGAPGPHAHGNAVRQVVDDR